MKKHSQELLDLATDVESAELVKYNTQSKKKTSKCISDIYLLMLIP